MIRQRYVRTGVTVVVAMAVGLLSPAGAPAGASGATAPGTPTAPGTQTVVAIQGTQWTINGQLTHPGTAAQGLLLNSRMIQGLFDDENAATVGTWAYPDTHTWDPQRNTDELVAALPSYKAHGLDMLTVGLQGGCPQCSGINGQNITSAFTADGSLKSAWLSRLDQLIRAADHNGLVVDLSLFYYKQDQRLASDSAVQAGIANVLHWLVGQGYTNVLVETANECNIGSFYPSLACGGEAQTIAAAQAAGGGRIPVSVSYTGGSLPGADVVGQEDFVTLHGNNVSAGGITSMVNSVRALAAYQAHPKPIIFNEDGTGLANMDAAVAAGASWGYYDQGSNNYVDGYQSPPVNWGINTASKQAFFAHVAALTGASGTPTAVASSATAVATQTPPVSATASATATGTATATPSRTATATATATRTATATATPTGTATPTNTATATVTRIATVTAMATQTATATPPPPPAGLAVKPARGVPFQTIALTGTTFGPSEPVALYWDRISTTPLATTTTTASGSFQARIRLPPAVAGYHLLIARGRTSSRTAASFVRIVPRFIVVPASGAVGTRVAITGVGFGAREWVAAYWDKPSSLLGLGLSNGVGSVSMTATIPLSSAGFHVVYGLGWPTYAVGTGLFAVP